MTPLHAFPGNGHLASGLLAGLCSSERTQTQQIVYKTNKRFCKNEDYKSRLRIAQIGFHAVLSLHHAHQRDRCHDNDCCLSNQVAVESPWLQRHLVADRVTNPGSCVDPEEPERHQAAGLGKHVEETENDEDRYILKVIGYIPGKYNVIHVVIFI